MNKINYRTSTFSKSGMNIYLNILKIANTILIDNFRVFNKYICIL